jgi:hypothetical protein
VITLTLGAFMFQANKDIDMENVTAVQLWAMQDKFCDLYFDIYGYRPDFGTVSDWHDIGWVTRMYDSLYKEYNSLPEEFDLATDFYS